MSIMSVLVAAGKKVATISGAGYWASGINSFSGTHSGTVDKFPFVTETRSTLAQSVQANFASGGYQSSVKGFVVGGQAGATQYLGVNSFNFSSDAVALVSSTALTTGSGRSEAISGSNSSYGYALFGYNATGYGSYSIGFLRHTFATDVFVNNSTLANKIRTFENATTPTSLYSIGDTYDAPATGINFVFATETYSTNGISAGATGYGGAFNSTTNGYFVGGVGSTFSNAIRKAVFATNAFSTLSAVIRPTSAQGRGTNSTAKGYYAGGYTSPTVISSAIGSFNFATETALLTSTTLSIARYGMANGIQSGGGL